MGSWPATHDTTTKVKAEEHAHTVNWCMVVWCKLGQPSETECGCPGGTGIENAVIRLDIFQISVTAIWWLKWFAETGQTVTVTGQIHSHLHYCQSCTNKHLPAPFPV